MELVIVLSFFILVAIGVPIAFVLGLSALTYILVSGELTFLTNMPQTLLNGVNNFTLLAFPFFMLLGELMNMGGLSDRIISFVRKLIGHLRGGLAYVNIIVSTLLAALIGSANAVSAITATSIVPEMRKDGYKNDYASAVTAASSIIGQIIPPSLVMIIFAVAAGISVGELFIAGIVPGLMISISFIIVAIFFSRKDTEIVIRDKANKSEILKEFLIVLPPLSIPILIIWGIVAGVFTPTEAGAIGCLFAFILGFFVYKELKWSDLPKVFLRTGTVTAGILIIMSTANLFGWVLAMERIPQMVASGLLSVTEQPLLLLLLITCLLVIVGFFLDSITGVLILVPVLLPVVHELGIDPLHFGIIMIMTLVLGLITPPVGLVLFIVSSITKVSIFNLSRKVVPFVIATLIVVVLIIFIPSLVTYLPSVFIN